MQLNGVGFRRFKNFIKDVPEYQYKELESYIQILAGIARITNQCIYIVDFYKGELPYMSYNPLFLCGMEPDEVKKMGSDFNARFVPKKDNEYTVEITYAWFKFLDNQPVQERTKYSVRYDYMLDGKLICVTMTPAFLSNDGKPWLLVCNARISTYSHSGNGIIMKDNSPIIWHYSEKAKKWYEDKMVLLNNMEREVLRLSIQGKKEKEICDLIFRSKDGLKTIKRKLFKKMEVNNITEAVSFAISYGLL